MLILGGDDSDFGTLLVVVLSVQLFSSGFESGTIWTLLSKPMLAEYVVAKFCAIQLLMLLCLTLMSGTLAWQLYLYAGTTTSCSILRLQSMAFAVAQIFNFLKSCFNASRDFSADTFGDHVVAFMRID